MTCDIRPICAAAWLLTTIGLAAGSTAMAQSADGATVFELVRREAETALRIAELRIEIERRVYESAQERLRAGIGDALEVAAAELKVAEAETELRFTRLDIEEVAASRAPVRREISAPRIGDRDFVGERMQMELEIITRHAAAAAELARLAELRARSGLGDAQLAQRTTARERARAALDRQRALLELRGRFLAGEIGAEEAELRRRLLLAEEREQGLRAELAALQAANGAVEPPDDERVAGRSR